MIHQMTVIEIKGGPGVLEFAAKVVFNLYESPLILQFVIKGEEDPLTSCLNSNTERYFKNGNVSRNNNLTPSKISNHSRSFCTST